MAADTDPSFLQFTYEPACFSTLCSVTISSYSQSPELPRKNINFGSQFDNAITCCWKQMIKMHIYFYLFSVHLMKLLINLVI